MASLIRLIDKFILNTITMYVQRDDQQRPSLTTFANFPAQRFPDYSTLAAENSELKEKLENLTSRIDDIVATSVREERGKTRAILRAGREVRNRHLELCRQVLKKNDEAVQRGNSACTCTDIESLVSQYLSKPC